MNDPKVVACVFISGYVLRILGFDGCGVLVYVLTPHVLSEWMVEVCRFDMYPVLVYVLTPHKLSEGNVEWCSFMSIGFWFAFGVLSWGYCYYITIHIILYLILYYTLLLFCSVLFLLSFPNLSSSLLPNLPLFLSSPFLLLFLILLPILHSNIQCSVYIK